MYETSFRAKRDHSNISLSESDQFVGLPLKSPTDTGQVYRLFERHPNKNLIVV